MVRDTDVGDYGTITAIDRKHGLYMIDFADGTRDWLMDTYLEVIKCK